MKNYIFEPEFLSKQTAQKQRNLAKKKPEVDFTEFASNIIYARLKSNIQRYRVYGPYWWALKEVLRKQGFNVGSQKDDEVAQVYRGANDAETIVAADMFYEDMSNKVIVSNNRWTLDDESGDYVLYDEDMESRNSVDEPIIYI
ncbi:hypothetical protein [Psychrobacter sp. I-STPA10]|uniref:hypothetical protein n=1 Tax=Psychrobacter sp. I-STPA10 TaxID=2585769 RepID=UPI001E42C4BF|nr:hypothetical protein [Psychrobacter sp. I-STPA10]